MVLHVITIDTNLDMFEMESSIRKHANCPEKPYFGPIAARIRIGMFRSNRVGDRRIPVGTPDAFYLADRIISAATGSCWRARAQVSNFDVSRFYTEKPFIQVDFREVCTPEQNCHGPTTIARGRPAYDERNWGFIGQWEDKKDEHANI
jgi:hypothetical protein